MPDKTPEKPQMPFSSLSALFDNSRSSSFGFVSENTGIGLGLRATMPRMPSFRVNISLFLFCFFLSSFFS